MSQIVNIADLRYKQHTNAELSPLLINTHIYIYIYSYI